MRRLVVAGLVVVALGAAGALAVRALVRPDDAAEIRALFRDGARAIAAKRVGDAMEHVSTGFSGEGLDRRGLHRLVLGHVLRGSHVAVHVAAERIVVDGDGDGDGAGAVLLVVAARTGAGTALAELLPANATALRVACRLAREDGTWRVTAAEWREIGVDEARTAAVEWLAPAGR